MAETGCVDSTASSKARSLSGASDIIGKTTANLERLITNIEKQTDCENLKDLISGVPFNLDDLIEGATDQVERIASTFLPLLKIPQSLQGVISRIKKHILGPIVAQLEAYIILTQQLIALLQLASRLASTIEQVIPRLEQCAIDTINQEIYGIQSAIDTSINTVIVRLTNQINEQLCDLGPALTDLGTILNDATINTTQVVRATQSLTQQVDQSIDSTLSTINTIGSSLQQITPITFNIDTSTKQAFNQSIASGAFTEFQQSASEFLNLAFPTNTTAPTISGTAALGDTLAADPGVWEGDDITVQYQWYRNQIPIYNATSSTYQLTVQDQQSTIYCQVTATNTAGEEAVQTDPITTTYVTGGLFSFGQRL
jgi:hypothetical protein